MSGEEQRIHENLIRFEAQEIEKVIRKVMLDFFFPIKKHPEKEFEIKTIFDQAEEVNFLKSENVRLRSVIREALIELMGDKVVNAIRVLKPDAKIKPEE